MSQFDITDERLNEMPREDVSAMIEWLVEGNSKEDLAIQVLERMSDDELAALLKEVLEHD